MTTASLSRERLLIVSHWRSAGVHRNSCVLASSDRPSRKRISMRQESYAPPSTFQRNVGAAISGGKTAPFHGYTISTGPQPASPATAVSPPATSEPPASVIEESDCEQPATITAAIRQTPAHDRKAQRAPAVRAAVPRSVRLLRRSGCCVSVTGRSGSQPRAARQ